MAVAAEHLNREDVLRVLADIESRGRATWTTSEIAREMGEQERWVRAAGRGKGGRGANDERPAGPGRHVLAQSVLGEAKRTASGLIPMLALYGAVLTYLAAMWVAL